MGDNMNQIKRLFISIIFIFVGCSSSKPSNESNNNMPDWYLNPPSSSEFYYGVGMAKKQNPSLAKKVAANRARSEISQSVNAKVSSLIKDFMQESGIGETAQALEFNESVSKSVSDNTLTNNTIKEVFNADDGTIYVLIEMPKKAVIEQSLNAAKKEQALFNEFKASQGFQELEKALSNM